MTYLKLGGCTPLRRGSGERGMGLVKSTIILELSSEVVTVFAPGVQDAGRFQVIVEYAAGVCIPTVVAESPDEAVEAFLVQAPGCNEGEISLFDSDEQRVVASVKWKMDTTEIGLRVPRRQNIFRDWDLALIACQVQRREQIRVTVGSSAESA